MQNYNPYGQILSLAGLMAGLQGSNIGNTLPDAAALVRGQEYNALQEANAERQRQMDVQRLRADQQEIQQQQQMQSTLAQFALQHGNEGLAGLLDAGIQPQQALMLQQALNPALSSTPEDEFVRLKEGETLFQKQRNPETGELSLRPFGGENNISKDQKKINDEIMASVNQEAKTGGTLLKYADAIERNFDLLEKEAPSWLTPGSRASLFLDEKTKLGLYNDKARGAAQALGKDIAEVFNQKVSKTSAGAAMRDRVLEQLQKGNPDTLLTPYARQEILHALKTEAAYARNFREYMQIWKRVRPQTIREGEFLGNERFHNFEFLDETGKVKPLDIKRMVAEDLRKADQLDEGVIAEYTNNANNIPAANPEQEIPSIVAPSREELLAIIRQQEPNFGR